MPPTRLVRPDGSIFVTDRDPGTYEVLGYKREAPEAYDAQMAQQGQQDYWTSPGERAKTVVEGLGSGITLGVSDALLDKFAPTDDFRNRAEYNPGTRMASEIVGGILPALAVGPEALLTPAGALMAGAEGVAGSLAKRTVVKGAIRGAIEGAGFGYGSALSEASIKGDPLTAEAINAGVGFGALFGGAIGGIASGVGGALASREARAASKIAAGEALETSTREGWDAFRGALRDAGTQVDEAVNSSRNVRLRMNESVTQVKGVQRAIREMQDTVLVTGESGEARAATRAARSSSMEKATAAFEAIQAAAKSGDAVGLEKAMAKYSSHVDEMSQLTGAAKPELAPFIAEQTTAAKAAVEEMVKMGSSQKLLKTFPTTVEDFARTSPEKAEKYLAAVDRVLSTTSPELQPLRESVQAGTQRLADVLGIAADGRASDLRTVYEAARAAVKQGVKVAEQGREGLPWLHNMAKTSSGAMARSAVGALGGGALMKSMAGSGARDLVGALLGLKQAVIGTSLKAATEWVPKAMSKAGPLGSRVGQLAVKLDGSEDKGNKDARSLMKARSEEIRLAAPNIRDTLYKNVSGLNASQPELAAAMHAHAVASFQFLLNKLPRDPGKAMMMGKSLWAPSPVDTEKFARYYEVFQNPTSVMKNVMTTGRITPEAAEGLREMYPSLFTALRVEMLDRLGDKQVQKHMTYSAMVSLGTLLNLPLHSSMTPEFVANQQQMFVERNEPMGITPQPGVGGNGGRPAGPANNPGATSSQKITAH